MPSILVKPILHQFSSYGGLKTQRFGVDFSNYLPEGTVSNSRVMSQ